MSGILATVEFGVGVQMTTLGTEGSVHCDKAAVESRNRTTGVREENGFTGNLRNTVAQFRAVPPEKGCLLQEEAQRLQNQQ
jgi:hypothetical protein